MFFFRQARAASGIKGLFHRNPKQASLDSHAAVQHSRKHPFGAHLLRRTASAPTKGQPKIKKGLQEITINTKDCSSEGTSEERESEDKAPAAASHQPTPPQHHRRRGDSLASQQANGAFHPEEGKGKSPLSAHRRPMSEPLKRAGQLRFRDPADIKPGVFARVALNGSGRVGMSSNCITCVVGSKDSPEAERKNQTEERQGAKSRGAQGERQGTSSHASLKKQVEPKLPDDGPPPAALPADSQPCPPHLKSCRESLLHYSPQALLRPIPFPRPKARQTLGAQHVHTPPDAPQRHVQSCSVPRRCFPNTVTPSLTPDLRTNLRWHQDTPPKYGAVCGSAAPLPRSSGSESLSLSDSSSCDSFGSLSSLDLPPMLPPRSVLDSRKRAVGTLQREMNALFAQKMEELRHKSPMFFAGKVDPSHPQPVAAPPHVPVEHIDPAGSPAPAHQHPSVSTVPVDHRPRVSHQLSQSVL